MHTTVIKVSPSHLNILLANSSITFNLALNALCMYQ